MRKDEYLSLPAVKNFIRWLEKILDTPQSFVHGYYHKKYRKRYDFDNLFSAYESYDWDRDYTIEELSDILMKSIVESDEKSCEDTCYKILEWGGVKNKGNKDRISALSPNVCTYLLAVQKRLEMDLPSSEYSTPEMHMTSGFPKIHMTSGFSKIYSACNDQYMIYDSRVGAALGLLVRKFCEEDKDLTNVPCELQFAWTNGRGEQERNPNHGRYEFPKLRSDKKGEYLYLGHNIRANWLMSEVAKSTKSNFARLEPHFRLRALEQALFMIGYDISQ